MSIIVSVKIHDGIVMAADSATTFVIGQIYEHANKIVNLVKGIPIGVMTCGAAGIGNASIATLLKDLRQRLSGGDPDHLNWKLDATNYTVESVAATVYRFFKEKHEETAIPGSLLLRICGYSSGQRQGEIWQVVFHNGQLIPPASVQDQANFGPRWNGEMEALDRLILGVGTVSPDGAKALNLTPEQFEEARNKVMQHTYENMILPAAPIQDAIDLARFMVGVTGEFTRFAVRRIKTVGGPTEIAVITKHEGFKWVQRKHFFDSKLNP